MVLMTAAVDHWNLPRFPPVLYLACERWGVLYFDMRSPSRSPSRPGSIAGSRPSSCASIRLSPVVPRSRPPSALVNFIPDSRGGSDEADDEQTPTRRGISSPTAAASNNAQSHRKRALEHLRSEIWPLPRSPARWYFARFKLRVWWVDGRLARQPYRPTVIAVINMTNRYLLAVIPLKGADPPTPSVEDGICVLLRAMQSDYPGNRQLHNPKGSRPRKIGFGDSSLVSLIGPSLQEVGVGVTGGDPPSDALHAIRSFSGMIRRTLKVDSPTHDATGICAAPGVSPALLSKVFESVSHFLKHEIAGLSKHAVFCVRLLSNNQLRFFSVLREGNQCAGLAMFSSLRQWSLLYAAQLSGNEGVDRPKNDSALAVIAQHLDLIPFDDIEALETFGGSAMTFSSSSAHRLPAFVKWRHANCPAEMQDSTFRRQLPICAPQGEDLGWFEVALGAIGAMLGKMSRGLVLPFSRTCSSVGTMKGPVKFYLSSFDSRGVSDQLIALHQHDLRAPQRDIPLLDQHLSNRVFWPNLDARHGGLLKKGPASAEQTYLAMLDSPSKSLGASSRSLYIEGQVTSLPNRAGSSNWHPKSTSSLMDDDAEGLGLLSASSPGLSSDPLMAASRSLAVTQGRGLERRLDELEATLENNPQNDWDSEVHNLMRTWSEIPGSQSAFDDTMRIGSPGSPTSTYGGEGASGGGTSTPMIITRKRTEKTVGQFKIQADTTGMQAAFREAREKELDDNHKGGLSDFLDGIGGECYRAGKYHDIPIKERLGLLGPLDRLGQNEHKQKIVVVEDQRCELWQGVLTDHYDKKWLPQLLQTQVLPPLKKATIQLEEEMEMEDEELDGMEATMEM